jgi:hypothetical protein
MLLLVGGGGGVLVLGGSVNVVGCAGGGSLFACGHVGILGKPTLAFVFNFSPSPDTQQPIYFSTVC